MEIYKTYRKVAEGYLNGRKIENLEKAELYTLSRLLNMEPEKLPTSYHTKEGLINWIETWIALEVLAEGATDAGNERRN